LQVQGTASSPLSATTAWKYTLQGTHGVGINLGTVQRSLFIAARNLQFTSTGCVQQAVLCGIL
jgi:hypothetical protein